MFQPKNTITSKLAKDYPFRAYDQRQIDVFIEYRDDEIINPSTIRIGSGIHSSSNEASDIEFVQSKFSNPSYILLPQKCNQIFSDYNIPDSSLHSISCRDNQRDNNGKVRFCEVRGILDLSVSY